ncbi:hypothetical protein INR49_025408, partial [Caranx melampygus]
SLNLHCPILPFSFRISRISLQSGHKLCQPAIGLAFWTLEAGGVAGQNRRESSMDPASHTGPRRLSGQALQDQLADGCLRIMTSAADCWGRGRLIAPLEALWVRLLVRLGAVLLFQPRTEAEHDVASERSTSCVLCGIDIRLSQYQRLSNRTSSDSVAAFSPPLRPVSV